ncbi:ligase IV, DNA, ATP-dependent [Reticulomyxa filosa]|uniref:Ligase IV, DNA, ATP-dependent n=1 Tax=Reticulomyxa filosa TaxID=46433 RepID=X6MLQ0_RETFI|nr:ligase IV, DNA, ATP-dependent [Reticulomyxa filosa]|eukprot:ETO14799.1 ligase IV, DNA, ATP-dependent [Reticulomyxa filosa]
MLLKTLEYFYELQFVFQLLKAKATLYPLVLNKGTLGFYSIFGKLQTILIVSVILNFFFNFLEQFRMMADKDEKSAASITSNFSAKQESAMHNTRSEIENIPFFVFCQFLTKLSQTSKASQKKEMLCNFFKSQLKNNVKSDFYCFMRLLLPHLDMQRQSYQIKEKMMGSFYVKAIPLQKDSEAANKLKKYKNPTFGGNKVGDFSMVLLDVLERRSSFKGKKTLFEVNEDLNKLTTCSDANEKVQWFGNMLLHYGPLEHMWLSRIILRDLRCGVRHESCLKNFHPNALETYNMTTSLEKVCQLYSDHSNAIRPLSNGRIIASSIQLFQPIKPINTYLYISYLKKKKKNYMLWLYVRKKKKKTLILNQRLASRRDYHHVVEAMRGKNKEKKDKVNICVEVKFDGERIMIHYRKNDKIMLWSRNAVDLEKKYGYVKAFEEIIQGCFLCESCIIDGEMMAWDEKNQVFVAFGQFIQQQKKKKRSKINSIFFLCDF